jgi:hypothetical protein
MSSTRLVFFLFEFYCPFACCLLLLTAISPDTNVQLSLHEHAVRKSFVIALRRIRRSLPGKEEWNREDDCCGQHWRGDFAVGQVLLYCKKSFSLNTWVISDFDLFPNWRNHSAGNASEAFEEVSNEVTWVIRRVNNEGVQTGIQDFPKRWTAVIKHNGDYIEGL